MPSRAAGTRVNLNQLGEAVLGEEEAARRLEAVLNHLANPDVNYISVKISAIFSQINLLDWDGTLATLKERLRKLYRAAMPSKTLRPMPSKRRCLGRIRRRWGCGYSSPRTR